VRLSDVVLVPSVQHTGTWFVIRFLQRFFPTVRELTFAMEDTPKPGTADVDYEMTYSSPINGKAVLHVHLPIARYLNWDVGWPDTVFHRRWFANLATVRSLPVRTIMLFCNLFKAVVPVRDPMAAILTREARHPQFRHFFIVDGFVALATEFARHPNVMFLPVDAADTEERRAALLAKALRHVGVDPGGHRGEVAALAASWLPENETPNNRFKDMYDAGDLDGLRRELGPKWAEVEYLRNMSSIILPFLEGVGYTRGQLRY